MASAKSLGSLTLDLILKMGGFEQGMNKAARVTDQRMQRIQKSAKVAGTAIGVALVAGTAIAIRSLSNAIDRMDDMSKAAQRVQMPTEQFSQLAYAGSLADVSMEDLQSSLGRLAKAQGAANNETSKQAKLFKALAVEAIDPLTKQLRSGIDVLYDFADVFKANKGSPELMAAGMEIFGRSFQKLIPLIKDGSEGLRAAAEESDRLGNTLSAEAGESAERFNDNLTRLNTVVKGFWQEIAGGLTPALGDATERLIKVAEKGDLAENIVTLLSAAFRLGVGAIEGYSEAVHRASIQLEGYIGIVGGLEKALIQGATSTEAFNEGIAQVGASARKEMAALDELAKPREAKIKIVFAGEGDDPSGLFKKSVAEVAAERDAAGIEARINAALGGNKKAAKKGGKSESERDAERLQQAYESMNSRLAEQIALFGSTGEAAKLRYDLENGELAKLTQAQKDNLLVHAEAYDQMVLMKELEDAAAKAVNREREAFNERMESNKQLIEDMDFELSLLVMTNKERERAIALSYLSADATEEDRQAVIRRTDALIEGREALENWNQLQDGISDGLFDIISGAESATDALKNFFDELNAQILRNITDDWAESIADLFKGMSSGSGSGSGGNFWVGLFSSFIGGGKAGGGFTRPFSATRVNEVGFEMATVNGNDYLLTGSQPVGITSSNQVRGGGTTVVNMTLQGRIDKRSEARIAREISIRQRMAMVGA